VKTRTEIRPEVYVELREGLDGALLAAKSLSMTIPAMLSGPRAALDRLDVCLAKIQGAMGSIDIVPERESDGIEEQAAAAAPR